MGSKGAWGRWWHRPPSPVCLLVQSQLDSQAAMSLAHVSASLVYLGVQARRRRSRPPWTRRSTRRW